MGLLVWCEAVDLEIVAAAAAAVVAFVFVMVVVDSEVLAPEVFEFGCCVRVIANMYVERIVQDDEAKLNCRAAKMRLELWV